MQLLAGHHQVDEFFDPAGTTAAVIANILGSSHHSGTRRQHAEGAAQIGRLIQSGARIDAALALIALELPQWQLRRIAYDGGEWHCALSRRRELADWLDQSVDGWHSDLALALLDALVEAQQVVASSRQPSVLSPLTDAMCTPLCCDNFS
ncbi:hypothetical protein [Bradyrhizobium sp. STM 3557]|uniref:hypothetical protein n=1 Tax=Bradyrhizobium sp. STM 3557 TaxID=578920 RepID=UPI00388FE249